jgi:signal transduction histidine kinase
MAKLHHNSIARKLTWMNLLVSGAALLLACLSFIGYDWVTFRQTTVENLSAQARIIGANSASALLFNDPDSANATLSALKSLPHIVSAGIETLDGKPFASYRRADADRPAALPPIAPRSGEAYAFENGNVVLVRPIVFQGKPAGTVYIESDLSLLYARSIRYAGIASVVLVACLLAALLISTFFRRAVAYPIVGLADTARIVSRERNYSIRAKPARDQGELAVLIEAFNEMLAQIQQRDEALRKVHDELEQRVQERTAQLAAANKELEAFSYSVSHDLRAPLRSIDGFSQAVLEDYADRLDSTGKQHLQRVRSAAVRMATLIDDLLNLSRVTRTEMHREPSDLSAIAKSIARELQESEPERKADFLIADGLTAEGDARLLRVVMENLLNNSWKYTSRHKSARIEFGHSKSNGRSVFYVRDDGAGFDQQYAGRLFGVFQRLHGMSEFPGTGVGLATVQRIIHRHGGEIWAEGEVEKGATFYFSL